LKRFAKELRVPRGKIFEVLRVGRRELANSTPENLID
jgi:hypothetical protein